MKLRLGGLQALADKAKKPVIVGRSYSFTAHSVQKEIDNYDVIIDSFGHCAGFHMPTTHRANVSIPFSGALYDTISDWMWSRESATVSLNPADFSTSFLITGAHVEEMYVQMSADDTPSAIDLTLTYNTWSFFHAAS